jgi:hypothetical protein
MSWQVVVSGNVFLQINKETPPFSPHAPAGVYKYGTVTIVQRDDSSKDFAYLWAYADGKSSSAGIGQGFDLLKYAKDKKLGLFYLGCKADEKWEFQLVLHAPVTKATKDVSIYMEKPFNLISPSGGAGGGGGGTTQDKGSLRFTVKDKDTGNAISGATVYVGGKTGTTSSSGVCTISDLNTGSQSYTVYANGYKDYSGTATVVKDTTTDVTVAMEKGAGTTPPTTTGGISLYYLAGGMFLIAAVIMMVVMFRKK